MQIRHRVLLSVLSVMVLLGVLHALALTFYFYWQLWWYDILMHFLGGVALGLAGVWAFLLISWYTNIQIRGLRLLICILAGTLFVGLGWELFELRFGLHEALNYGADTSLDLLMDVIGAAGAYLLSRLKFSSVLE